MTWKCETRSWCALLAPLAAAAAAAAAGGGGVDAAPPCASRARALRTAPLPPPALPHPLYALQEYRPAKLQFGPPHPDAVVETASLAAVDPPDISYELKAHKELVDAGVLSALQARGEGRTRGWQEWLGGAAGERRTCSLDVLPVALAR